MCTTHNSASRKPNDDGPARILGRNSLEFVSHECFPSFPSFPEGLSLLRGSEVHIKFIIRLERTSSATKISAPQPVASSWDADSELIRYGFPEYGSGWGFKVAINFVAMGFSCWMMICEMCWLIWEMISSKCWKSMLKEWHSQGKSLQNLFIEVTEWCGDDSKAPKGNIECCNN